jgi:3-hydroxyisobutyrate dehydrogenase-like beta-hydroxyacid dehydrogenase
MMRSVAVAVAVIGIGAMGAPMARYDRPALWRPVRVDRDGLRIL